MITKPFHFRWSNQNLFVSSFALYEYQILNSLMPIYSTFLKNQNEMKISKTPDSEKMWIGVKRINCFYCNHFSLANGLFVLFHCIHLFLLFILPFFLLGFIFRLTLNLLIMLFLYVSPSVYNNASLNFVLLSVCHNCSNVIP